MRVALYTNLVITESELTLTFWRTDVAVPAVLWYSFLRREIINAVSAWVQPPIASMSFVVFIFTRVDFVPIHFVWQLCFLVFFKGKLVLNIFLMKAPNVFLAQDVDFHLLRKCLCAFEFISSLAVHSKHQIILHRKLWIMNQKKQGLLPFTRLLSAYIVCMVSLFLWLFRATK